MVHNGRVLRVATISLVAALAPAAAHGQLEHKGSVSLGAERLFGLNHTTVTTELGGAGESSLSRTDFGLFIPLASSFASLPRLAVDVTIIDGLTLGGALGVIISDSSNGNTAGGFGSSSSGIAFLVSPRIGWAVAVGRAAHLWLRGGISYFRASNKSGSFELTQDGFSVALEPALVVMVAEHFGLLASALVDLPLTGEVTAKPGLGGVSTSSSMDFKTRTLGAVVGLTFIF